MDGTQGNVLDVNVFHCGLDSKNQLYDTRPC